MLGNLHDTVHASGVTIYLVPVRCIVPSRPSVVFHTSSSHWSLRIPCHRTITPNLRNKYGMDLQSETREYFQARYDN